jgi:CBS domain-containing protein
MLIEHILRTKGTEVATIRSTASIAEALDELAQWQIGALVVSDDDATVAGILSERDIVRAMPGDGGAVLERSVGDLMTSAVATCEPTTTVEHAMQVMTERRVRHLPVLVDGRLAGIVSIGDVVKSRVGELETEASTLHDYLESGR